MLRFQMFLDELFIYTKRYSSKLLRWDFDSPFLGQSIRFLIARYPMMIRVTIPIRPVIIFFTHSLTIHRVLLNNCRFSH
jgi:hypothetical protein